MAVLITSCNEEKYGTPEAVFDVLENGVSILNNGTVVNLDYDDNLALDLKMSGVASIETVKPEGWDCAIVKSENKVTLKAPSSSDMDAEKEGKVLFKIFDGNGTLTEYEFRVKATEMAMTFNILGIDTKETLLFKQGGDVNLEFTCSKNVVSFKKSITEGWTANADMDAKIITISAPADESVSPEGELTLTPVSAFLTEGESLSFKMKVSKDIPTMAIEKPMFAVQPGATIEIPYTGSFISTVSFSNVPQDWKVEADIQNNKVIVSAPTTGSPRADITVKYESLVGITGEPVSFCCKFPGINCIEDLHALGSVIDDEEAMKAYIIDGEVKLNTDLTITDADLIHVDGSSDSKAINEQRKAVVSIFYGYSFNGSGHTITYDIAPDFCRVGFFYIFGCLSSAAVKDGVVLDELSTLHDLNFEGKIASTYTTTAKSQGMLLAPAVVYNKGGKLSKVTSSVAISHIRTDISSLSNNDLIKQGIIGGITANDQFGKCEYVECSNSGSIRVEGGIQNVGGITGYTETYSNNKNYTVMTGCTNTADINIIQKSGMHSDAYIGGMIGASRASQPILTGCINRGNFTIDLDGGVGSIQGCGGIIGSGYGTLDGCKNYGNITAHEAAMNGTAAVNRRYGGIIGGPGAVSTSTMTDFQLSQQLTDCVNYGNIKAASSMMGGIVGQTEKNYGEASIFRRCVNEGTIESTEAVMRMGGIVGQSSGANLYNCVNKGTLKGALAGGAGSMVGVIYWANTNHTWIIDGCENYGNFDFTGANTSGAVAAGIIVMGKNVAAKYVISNCKADFSINGENLKKEPVVGAYGTGIISAFQIDDFTKENCKIK